MWPFGSKKTGDEIVDTFLKDRGWRQLHSDVLQAVADNIRSVMGENSVGASLAAAQMLVMIDRNAQIVTKDVSTASHTMPEKSHHTLNMLASRLTSLANRVGSPGDLEGAKTMSYATVCMHPDWAPAWQTYALASHLTGNQKGLDKAEVWARNFDPNKVEPEMRPVYREIKNVILARDYDRLM